MNLKTPTVVRPQLAGLYAIADTQYLDDAHLMPAVGEAISGGARVIQYRDKKHTVVDRARQASHLIAPTHSEQFLTLLSKHYPSWREARAELNELPLGAEVWKE